MSKRKKVRRLIDRRVAMACCSPGVATSEINIPPGCPPVKRSECWFYRDDSCIVCCTRPRTFLAGFIICISVTAFVFVMLQLRSSFRLSTCGMVWSDTGFKTLSIQAVIRVCLNGILVAPLYLKAEHLSTFTSFYIFNLWVHPLFFLSLLVSVLTRG